MKNPFEYQKPTERSVKYIEAFRELAKNVQTKILDTVSESRERSLALTKLEEMSMWLNKAIVFTQTKDEDTSVE